jgi:hypothetical protein
MDAGCRLWTNPEGQPFCSVYQFHDPPLTTHTPSSGAWIISDFTSFWSKIFIISFDCPLVQARPSDIGWTIRAGLSCAGNTLRRVAAENQGPNRVPRITLHSLCILSSYSLFSLPFDPFWSLLHPAWSEHCEVLRDETHFSLPSHLIPLGEMKPILRYPLFSFTVSR